METRTIWTIFWSHYFTLLSEAKEVGLCVSEQADSLWSRCIHSVSALSDEVWVWRSLRVMWPPEDNRAAGRNRLEQDWWRLMETDGDGWSHSWPLLSLCKVNDNAERPYVYTKDGYPLVVLILIPSLIWMERDILTALGVQPIFII